MAESRWKTRDQEKQRVYRRTWYLRHTQHAKLKKAMRRAAITAWYKEYKATLDCIRCGENHPACLDFHHRDPGQKSFRISSFGYMGWSKDRILAEIAKCDVLCANCHRKLHYEEE